MAASGASRAMTSAAAGPCNARSAISSDRSVSETSKRGAKLEIQSKGGNMSWKAMQDIIKRYFWVLGAAVVLVCSVFAAKATSHVIESSGCRTRNNRN